MKYEKVFANFSNSLAAQQCECIADAFADAG